MNKKAIDYGDGIIWYFDNYPKEYFIDQCGRWVELPSQTLRIDIYD